MSATPSFDIQTIGFPRSSVRIERELKLFFAAGGTVDDLARQINSACQKVNGLFHAFGDPQAMALIEVFDDYSKFSAPVLLAAAREGRVELLQRYLERGADPEATNEWGVALVTAASDNVPIRAAAMVELLLKAGADPNTTHPASGYTPLMMAAGRGYRNVVEQLLGAGADVRQTCHEGETALHKVMRPNLTSGHTRHLEAEPVVIAKMLIAHGAQIEARSFKRFTPLLALASHGTKYARPLLEVLLEAGANLEVRSIDDLTPLLLAVQSNALDAISALLDAGADAQAVTKLGTGITRLGNAETKRLLKARAMARSIESAMEEGGAVAEITRRSPGLSATL